MKLVVDTNTIISGSLWQGPPARLISAALAGQAQMFLSLPMLLELQETFQRPKFARRLASQGETPVSLAARFRAACHEAVPARIIPPAELRDPDDVHVLACAVSAEADAIVTGDKDLLAMKTFQGIPIIEASEALKRLGPMGEGGRRDDRMNRMNRMKDIGGTIRPRIFWGKRCHGHRTPRRQAVVQRLFTT
ncbi:MAG: putative toxin-antitoxin system toxin component, PIN family, partial [Verrucomicrobia bacterium]|nr:putative toxin-antitoxin system toxin component, PIN family [Verrucomicrobiota bacterium]